MAKTHTYVMSKTETAQWRGNVPYQTGAWVEDTPGQPDAVLAYDPKAGPMVNPRDKIRDNARAASDISVQFLRINTVDGRTVETFKR